MWIFFLVIHIFIHIIRWKGGYFQSFESVIKSKRYKYQIETRIFMESFITCTGNISKNTLLDNTFIEHFLPEANGSYVKVYIYLSMCIQHNKPLSIGTLADYLESTEKDIIRALQYWEKKELLQIQYNEASDITALHLLSPSDSLHAAATLELPAQPAANPMPAATEPDTETAPAISVSEEQTLRLANNEDFSWICLIVESYLGHPLKPMELSLLTYLFDTLHFSKDLILYLYEYCCSLNKTSTNYVQAVALSWHENNITTPNEAHSFSAKYSTAHTAIAKALALGRTLAGIEIQYADRWQNQWNMDLAVILEACNRTMLAIQKADFKYLDGILNNWHNQNVHTLQDIEACDRQFIQNKAAKTAVTPAKPAPQKKNQFQNFQQRDISQDEMAELEKTLLSR